MQDSILIYALKWGLGHGGILLCLGLLLAFIGSYQTHIKQLRYNLANRLTQLFLSRR